MISGTEAQWLQHLSLVCSCGHEVREHANGRGPCAHRDDCRRLELPDLVVEVDEVTARLLGMEW